MNVETAGPSRDERHLNLLAVLHYVLAALTAALGLVGVPYLPLGWQLMHSAEGELPEVFVAAEKLLQPFMGPMPELHDPELRAWLGFATLLSGAAMISVGVVHGAALAYIGRCLARRRRRWLCIAFSIFNLTYVCPLPLGTILSACTLAVLLRRSARPLFARPAVAAGGAAVASGAAAAGGGVPAAGGGA